VVSQQNVVNGQVVIIVTQERVALVKARQEANMSQLALAEAVKCTQQYISAIEAGTRTPTPQMAKRLADAVRKSVDEVFPDIADFLRTLLDNKPL
jgi:transcriptional regulator with XRE-family HTH domain